MPSASRVTVTGAASPATATLPSSAGRLRPTITRAPIATIVPTAMASARTTAKNRRTWRRMPVIVAAATCNGDRPGYKFGRKARIAAPERGAYARGMMIQDTSSVLAMPRSLSDDPRWSQVLTRAAEADGRFVYAVKSTGVFCRPTCPSRRPRRAQVRFFADAGAAERAGYRACLRCAPQGARPVTPAARAVAKAASFLRAQAAEPVALAEVAALVGLSPSHLQRVFTAHTGVSPRVFHAACRAEEFRRALRAGRDVTSATYEAGYGSPSRVSAHQPTGRGLTPAAYRRGAAGETIRYAVVPCALGRLLVAATAKGVCAVKLGAADAALAAELASEFPAASVIAGVLPRAWVESVRRAVEHRPVKAADVPLDVQGTAFQWTVWKALQAIPPGETRTYAALAREIGRPAASRAVARACATNPVAVVVPCHRVVPSAGGVGGYRWGSGRKAALLRLEADGAPSAMKRR